MTDNTTDITTDSDHNSHQAINPETLPNFATMPNVATMSTDHVDKNQPPFILVDGSYYLFRTYHALPKTMQNSQGLITNAIRGTLNALLKLMRRYHPTHMAVCFDTKSPTFRHHMSADYKAGRPPIDIELVEQIPYIHRLVTALGIPLLRIEGAEADDIIGTLAHRAVEQGHHVVISTGDKDMMQLVNDCVILEDSFTGKITDTQAVIDKFGINPNQMIDFLTLMGDTSDGIKGVPGIGKKTAKDLLVEYGTIDNMLKHIGFIKGRGAKGLIEHAEEIPFNAKLATIVTDLQIGQDWNDLKINTDPCAHIDELRELYSELEFRNELASLDHPNHPANGSQSVADSQADAESQAQIAKSLQSTKMGNTKDSTAHEKAWHTVLDEPAFDSLVEVLASAPHFVIDTETTSVHWREAQIVGLSFAVQAHEAYYIPLTHSLEGDELTAKQLDRDTVLARLKPILENPKIGKIGQHLKYDAHILAHYDIDLVGAIHQQPNNWAMDTMLASYVINAAVDSSRYGRSGAPLFANADD